MCSRLRIFGAVMDSCEMPSGLNEQWFLPPVATSASQKAGFLICADWATLTNQLNGKLPCDTFGVIAAVNA